VWFAALVMVAAAVAGCTPPAGGTGPTTTSPGGPTTTAAPTTSVPGGPADAVPDQSLRGTMSPIWQTNDSVFALAVAKGVVYAGGAFTAVRPPGAAEGTNQTTRQHLAAFDAATGALVTSFNVAVNGDVRSLAVSPDGTRLYVGGAFTNVAGQTRNRLASIVLPSGTLDTGFVANADNNVMALAATSTGLYAGGDFGTIAGAAHTRIALLDRTTGAASSGFTASIDGRVRAIAVAPDGSRVLAGGSFDTVNGAVQGAIASLDPATGALRPWASTGIVPRPANGTCHSAVSGIAVQGANAYVTAEGDEAGCYEGIYAARISDGATLWDAHCLGAAQAIVIVNGWIYKGSHQHDCSRVPGGYVGPQDPGAFFWNRLTAWRVADGAPGHFSPNTNGAGDTHVGPLAEATDGSQLFVGGDFTSVDGTAQHGLARYSPTGTNAAPDRPAAPRAVATAAGTIEVTVGGVSDRDDGVLTYALYRDGGSTPIATRQVESYPWSLPTVRFTDAHLAGGSAHTYAVSVSDGIVTTARSASSASVVAPSSAPAPFPSVVASAGPASFWRLADGGATAADSSGANAPGTFVGGVTRGVPGALAGNAAVDLNGTSGYVTSAAAHAAPTTFTESVWFKTTTKLGGTLLGFSNAATGAGTNTDRVVFLENDGKVVFAMRNSATNPARFTFVRSPNTYRDGQWHQVVASYASNGTMSLSLDGVQVGSTLLTTQIAPGSGFLRGGYANLANFYAVFGRNYTGEPSPSSYVLRGTLDELALYPTVLSPAQVAAQYASGRAGA
jgi:hypothetical protein